MSNPKFSILISSYNRVNLLRRTLWAIANRGPAGPFEVVIADDASTEDTLSLVREYSSCFPWTFIRLDRAKFEKQTGVKHFFNNCSWSNNMAAQHSRGDYLFLQGNEIIAWNGVYNQLVAGLSESARSIAFSTTYDVPRHILDELDTNGSNLTQRHVDRCKQWPLQTETYRTDVTNYISLCHRSVWWDIEGYDERLVGGIACEDSDFVRRARARGCKTDVSKGVSLHQDHGGKNVYHEPLPSVISAERWDEGVRANRKIYDSWDKTPTNKQPWAWGCVGLGEVIKNWGG